MVRWKWGVKLAFWTTWKSLSWHRNPLFLVLWPMVDNLFDFLTAIHILQPSRLLISRQLNVKSRMFMMSKSDSQTLRALNQINFIRVWLWIYTWTVQIGPRYLVTWFVNALLFKIPKVLILMVPKNVSNGRRTKDKLIGKVEKLVTRRK